MIVFTDKKSGIDILQHAWILAGEEQLYTLVYERFTQAKALIVWLAHLIFFEYT